MNRMLCGLVAVSVMTLATPCYGQDFYAGVAGGLNFADVQITIVDPTRSTHETKHRTLFCVGGFFGRSFNEYLSVQLEPTYVAKGGIYAQAAKPEMRTRFSHLDLPLVAKLGIGEGVRPFVVAGPFMSFLFDANMTVDLAGREWEGNMMEVLKRTEYGVVLGAGVCIPVWIGSISIEGRSNLGLTNLNKGGSFELRSGGVVADRITTDPKDEITTRGILLIIGFQLPVGGE